VSACAALTGIPKAECERRDSPDANQNLPAGRTQGQMERQAQREAAAAAADRNTRPTDANRPQPQNSSQPASPPRE
jgi:hypothetical protein